MNIIKSLKELAAKNYTSWKEVKSHLDSIPDDVNKSLAGHIFQALSVEILRHIESADIKNIYNLDLDKVSPKMKLKYGLTKKDMGVDLLLETKAGKVYGVQVKYRSHAKTLGFAEVSTFLAHQKLPGHIIFSNTRSVVDIIHTQTKELKLFLIDKLLELTQEDWVAINSNILGKTKAVKYKPSYKPHQLKAVKNTVKMLKTESRCQIIHPCGTGKTYVMAHLVATMKPDLTIIAVPSLALEKQTKDVLVKQLSNTPSFGKFLYGVVGSDDSVDKDAGDTLTTEMGLCGLGVTTDAKEIAGWIKQAKAQKSKLIIFTTYQSIESVEKAVKKTSAKVGLIIGDEAHKTATHKKSTYTRIHSNKLIPAAKRVYMTATPRVFSKDPDVQDVVYDMSDVETFGKQADYLSFKDAIDQKLLTDYQMVAVSVDNEEVMKYAMERKYVNVDGTITDMEQIIGAIALHKARQKYKVNHTISYHTSNKNAEKFSTLYSTLFKKDSECYLVNGSMNAGSRIDILREFEESKSALVSNVRCLQEGVSINAVDSILFCDPKSSAVDIIQSAGRPMRLHLGKELGTIIIPVFHEKEEDLEGAIESGSWKDVVSVLRALGSTDERVQEWMMGVKSGNGERSGSGERNVLIVEKMPIAFLDFDKKYIDNVGLNVIGKSRVFWDRNLVEILLERNSFKNLEEWKKINPSSLNYARLQPWYNDVVESFNIKAVNTAKVNKENIIDFIKKNKRPPSKGSKDSIEKKLAGVFHNYLSKSSLCFDLKFYRTVRELLPMTDTVQEGKNKIIDFIKKHKRRPAQDSHNKEEDKLGQLLSQLINKTSRFDSDFKVKIDKLIPSRAVNVEINKKNIINFIKKNKRPPSCSSNDTMEKKLHYCFKNYTRNNSNHHEFKKQIEMLLKKLNT